MEPPAKKGRWTCEVNDISKKRWDPIKWTFLMGTQSFTSSIRRAFGCPVFHPLSELNCIRLIFEFQKSWPAELCAFQPPIGYDKDEDDRNLPLTQRDDRVLIMFRQVATDYFTFFPRWIHVTKVFYNPGSEKYEIFEIDFKYQMKSPYGYKSKEKKILQSSLSKVQRYIKIPRVWTNF